MSARDEQIAMAVVGQTLTDEGRGPAYYFIGSVLVMVISDLGQEADLETTSEMVQMQLESCRDTLIRQGISSSDISMAWDEVSKMLQTE